MVVILNTLGKIINKEFRILIAASMVCFCLTVLRVFLTKSTMYIFLNWNLFLAIIPYFISRIILEQKKNSGNRLLILLGFFLWLAFFPNAPYIITDLIHLRYSERAFLWYDILMVFLFAWLGLIFGIISLMNIEKTFISGKKSSKIHLLVSSAILLLCAYGIYLGRFLRWNSWDIISNPFGLMKDIFNTVIHPVQFYEAWLITGFIGILLISIYFTLKYLIKHSNEFLNSFTQK